MIVSFLKDFWDFLKYRKKWWLLPMLTAIGLAAVLVALTSGSAVAPFVYTIF